MRVFHKSIIGAGHVKKGMPLQDASDSAVLDGRAAVAVVCDGHGGAKHFRSEHGSRICCTQVISTFARFHALYPDYASLEAAGREALNRLKLAIITAWQLEIESYTAANPFSQEELKAVASSVSFQECRGYDIGIPYGTTLLASFVASDYYLLLMIGDGEIVKVTRGGAELVHFEGKEGFFDGPHGLTDSMCDDYSFNKLFVSCQACHEPVGFALCSDGMSEAIVDQETLVRIMGNYFSYWSEVGDEKALADIGTQMSEITASSPMKDDISLALVTNDLEALVAKETEEKGNEQKEQDS